MSTGWRRAASIHLRQDGETSTGRQRQSWLLTCHGVQRAEDGAGTRGMREASCGREASIARNAFGRRRVGELEDVMACWK